MAFPDSDLQVKVYAYLGADPTDDPSNWPAPVDLTSRLLDRDITISTGRQEGQRTAAASQCTLWLDNDDGALTPLLATSPYYPHWDLGVPIALDVDGVGASPPYGLLRGYAASIEADMVPVVGGGMVSAVRVVLGGIIRRLGQGRVARSTLRRYYDLDIAARLGRHVPIYYWPMDHGQPSAQHQARPAIGSEPLQLVVAFTDPPPDWAGADLAPWLGSGLQIEQSKILLGGTPAAAPAPLSALATDIVLRTTQTGNGFIDLGAQDAATAGDGLISYRIFAQLINGVLTTTLDWLGPSEGETLDTVASEVAASIWDGQPHHLRLLLVQDGSDVEVSAHLDGVPIASGVHSSATLDRLPRWRLSTGGSGFSGVFGHGALWINGIEPAADVWWATRGYVGETAAARFARVCAEEGIPHTPWSPAPTRDVQLGPQPIGTELDVLRDAELAGHGILYEETSTWGLGYRPLESRYNQSAALTIDLAHYNVTGNTSRDVLRPVRNDQRIRNEWTISRPGGSSVTVRDATHQAKRGRYTDSATVNIETDDGLLHEAGWRLHETTYDGLRYAAMPIDLGANPSLIGDWLALRPGDRIDRTNHPPQHPAETVSVILEGYSMTLRRRSWTVDAIVEPYLPWHVGVYADNSATAADKPSRYQILGCTTRAAFDTATDSVLQVNTPNGEFTSDPTFLPFVIECAGVVMEVSAVSGSGSSQDLTVTVINGVSKTIPTGSTVLLHRAARYGL